MDDDARNKELEKRERLVQTFLTIGGFFVAFTEDNFKQVSIAIFAIYLFFIMLYYIFLSRGYSTLIDYFAFLSSIPYTFLILILFYSHTPNSWGKEEFWFVFIVQTCILTFSLLSPERGDQVIESFIKLVKNNPKVTSASIVILIALLIYLIYVLTHIKFA